MPDMTPVANQVNPPDPMKGLNTFSGILGIKQQQQALQGQAAQVQQEQLRAHQQQGVQDFFNSWDPTEHFGDDGTLDTNSAMQSPAFKSAGNAKPAIMQALIDVKNRQLQSKQSLAQLNGTLINQLGTQVGALAKDEDVVADKADEHGFNPGRAKVYAYIQNFAKLGPDAARVAGIYGPMVQHVPQGKLSNAVQALQMQAQDVGGQQAQQNPVPGAFDTGANILPTVTNRATGVPQFTGQAIPKQLTPGQDPGYLARAAAASTTGGQSAQNDEQLYNQITQNASRVGQIKSFSGEVQQLAQEVKTGKYSKEGAQLWTAIAQRVPGFGNAELTEATRRQLLGKYTQQLMLQADQANGASTDAAQEHVRSAMPDPDHMSPDAIVDAARSVSGQADVANARAQLAMKHRNAQGNSQGLRDLDTRFMSQADPRAYVYQGLPAGEQRRQYLRDHPDFKNQLLLKLHQQ